MTVGLMRGSQACLMAVEPVRFLSSSFDSCQASLMA